MPIVKHEMKLYVFLQIMYRCVGICWRVPVNYNVKCYMTVYDVTRIVYPTSMVSLILL